MRSPNTTDEMCFIHMLMSESMEQPIWLQIVFGSLMLFIFVVGVGGNLLTCIVIYCDRSMHTVTNCYLFNLAVSDLIVGFGILVDLNSLSDYPLKFEGFGDTACRAHFFMVVALWNNGILIMTALAIERYIAVWHPLLLNRKPVWGRVMKIICVIWAVAILEALPEIWSVRLLKLKRSSVCFVVPSTYSRILNGILALVNFVIPLGIMTFVYTMVAFKVNTTQKNYSRDKIFNHRSSSKKVNKLVIALTLSFLGCWLPFFLIRVLYVVADWCGNLLFIAKHWDLLLLATSYNGWFSIVVNPLLFSLMSTKFRKSLKKMWNRKFRKHQRSLPKTQAV